jgi:hypothetical protein
MGIVKSKRLYFGKEILYGLSTAERDPRFLLYQVFVRP